jgi:glycosyltransferase involved in cell wall biosynthesis
MPDKVSVIIPCRNEGQTIRLVLAAFSAQTYPQDLMEIIIVDGLSEDNTRSEIMAFSQEHPELTIRIVDNPKRIIPAAVNAGILASSGDILGAWMPTPSPSPIMLNAVWLPLLKVGRTMSAGCGTSNPW